LLFIDIEAASISSKIKQVLRGLRTLFPLYWRRDTPVSTITVGDAIEAALVWIGL
jgi:hypothetical protein